MWIRNFQRTIQREKEGQKHEPCLCQNCTANDQEAKAVMLTRQDSNIWTRLNTLERPTSIIASCTKCLRHWNVSGNLFSSIQLIKQGEQQPGRTNYYVIWKGRCERAYKYCYRDLAVREADGYTVRQNTSSHWVKFTSVEKASSEDSSGT